MKVYIVVRWGNPYEEDKCDGRDTFFFVVARNHLNASRRVTRYLKETEPECSEMKYQYLCNQILELGEYTADSAKEYIIKLLKGKLLYNDFIALENIMRLGINSTS